MSRRKAREIAFKVLFQVDQVNADPEEVFGYLTGENQITELNKGFSWKLIQGYLDHRHSIDAKIQLLSRDWSLERMPSVDRNIMRTAISEILYLDEAQPVVAINEAIEIAKTYGDVNSSSFVNAILDKVYGERES